MVVYFILLYYILIKNTNFRNNFDKLLYILNYMYRQDDFSNGGNPFGNFQAPTSNNPINNRYNNNNSNYTNTFQNNQTMIERPDFRNKGNLIHNNIKDNVQHEYLNEYNINIESKDRTLTAYPNPCKFTVIFGGGGGQTIKKKVITKQNGTQMSSYEKMYMNGTTEPIIGRRFKNVKFVKLDYLILPKTFAVTQDPSGNYSLSTNPSYMNDRYKYLILKIKELSSNRTLSTNNVIGNDGILLYQDKYLGGSDNTLWRPANGIRFYPDGKLVNINKLTLSILDPFGNQLYVFNDATGKEIDINEIYEDIPESNVDVLNQRSLYDYLQLTLSFIIGVIENEINTDTKYEN